MVVVWVHFGLGPIGPSGPLDKEQCRVPKPMVVVWVHFGLEPPGPSGALNKEQCRVPQTNGCLLGSFWFAGPL